MVMINETLVVVNEIFIIPIVMIAFFLLMYIGYFLWKKDTDIIKSRIYLRHEKFNRSFQLFSVFAFVLIMHVSLIYIPEYFDHVISGICLIELQEFFGFTLTLIMVFFAYYLYSAVK